MKPKPIHEINDWRIVFDRSTDEYHLFGDVDYDKAFGYGGRHLGVKTPGLLNINFEEGTAETDDAFWKLKLIKADVVGDLKLYVEARDKELEKVREGENVLWHEANPERMGR